MILLDLLKLNVVTFVSNFYINVLIEKTVSLRLVNKFEYARS